MHTGTGLESLRENRALAQRCVVPARSIADLGGPPDRGSAVLLMIALLLECDQRLTHLPRNLVNEECCSGRRARPGCGRSMWSVVDGVPLWFRHFATSMSVSARSVGSL